MPQKKVGLILLLIGVQLTCQPAWHAWCRNDSNVYFSPREETRATARALSPLSIFQDQPISDEIADRRRSSISRDMKLMAAVYSIGAEFLIDDVPSRKFERTLDFQFRDKREFLNGIDIKKVQYTKGIVRIPYVRDGKKYLIRVIPNAAAWAVARQKCQRITPEMFDITATEAIDELVLASP